MPRKLSVFILAMMNASIVVGLEGLPTMAEYGLSLVTFYVFFTLVYFVPVAMISAELGSAWPEEGGVYVWVKQAFGERWALLAIWSQWIQAVLWYPTILAFTAAAAAYMIDPQLATSKPFSTVVILVVFWAVTLTNLRGIQASGIIGTFCFLAGTALPIALVMVMGAWWLAGGNPSQTPLAPQNLIPDLSSTGKLVLAAGAFSFLSGLEVNATHAPDVEDPQRNVPRAILISALVVLVVTICGSLSVAIVVPASGLELDAGPLQLFQRFFEAHGLQALVPLVAALIFLGAVGHISTWVVGPSQGLMVAANDGLLPAWFRRVNRHDVPVNVLLTQAVVVSLLSLVFLLAPSVSAAFWILTAAAAQVYLVMYVLMYAAALRLRHTQPEKPRTFRTPALPAIATVASLAALAGLLIQFLPPDPSQLQVGDPTRYVWTMVACFAAMMALPLLLYAVKDRL